MAMSLIGGFPVKQKLAELRKQRNVKREELALAVGTSYSNIVSLELGRSKPSLDLAQKIAHYFNMSTDDIDWSVSKDDPAAA